MASAITAFTYKKKLSYPVTSLSLTATLSNFPICIHINSSSWSTTADRTHLDSSGTTGKRVQFFDYLGTTNLPYEVEYYASSGGTTTEAVYWVQVPSVVHNSDTNNYIWIAYGNDPNGSDQDNGTAVWDSNFKMVQHLKDNPDTSHTADSTSNANNGSKVSTNNPIQATGQANYGQSFATDDYISTGTSVLPTGARTQSCWIKSNYTSALQVPFAYGTNQNFQASAILIYKTTGQFGIGTYNDDRSSGVSVTDNNWHQIVGTYEGSNNWKFYVDGSYIKTDAMATSTVNAYSNFGRLDSAGYYYTGLLDEVRLSNTNRSADWIKLEYYSMLKTNWNGDSYWTWAAEESTATTRRVIIISKWQARVALFGAFIVNMKSESRRTMLKKIVSLICPWRW